MAKSTISIGSFLSSQTVRESPTVFRPEVAAVSEPTNSVSYEDSKVKETKHTLW